MSTCATCTPQSGNPDLKPLSRFSELVSATPRAGVQCVRDDVDPQLSHYQAVIGNRLPQGTPGRLLRIEGVKLPGLDEEVTKAVWVGESHKDVDGLMAAGTPSRSS